MVAKNSVVVVVVVLLLLFVDYGAAACVLLRATRLYTGIRVLFKISGEHAPILTHKNPVVDRAFCSRMLV